MCTSWQMTDHRYNCAVIAIYYDINDKIEVVEFIFYYLHKFIRLHNFRVHIKVISALIPFCLLSHLIFSINNLTWLWKENHTKNPLEYTINDECMLTRLVVYPVILSLLSPHIICGGKFSLFYFFFIWYITTLHISLIVVCKCSFYLHFNHLFNC